MYKIVTTIFFLFLTSTYSFTSDSIVQHKNLNNISELLIRADHDPTLWAATDAGVVSYDSLGNVSQVLNRFNGLPDENIVDMAIDRNGNKWICLKNCLLVLTDTGVVTFDTTNSDDPFFKDQLMAIEISKNNTVFVGSDNRVITIDADTLTLNESFPFNTIALFTDNNSVYGTTAGGCIYAKMADTGYTPMFSVDLYDIRNGIFLTDDNGNIWQTEGGDLVIRNGVSGDTLKSMHDLNIPYDKWNSTITTIAEDITGKVWIGYDDGSIAAYI